MGAGRSPAQLLRLALLLVIAGAAVAFIGRWTQPAAPVADLKVLARIRTTPGPMDHPAALAAMNDQVTNNADRVAHDPANWVANEMLATALLARVRLGTDYQDYARAGAALARANAEAPAGAGPMFVTAAYALAVHRPRDAVAPLTAYLRQAMPPSEDERAEATAMLGDAALFTGDLAGAKARYDEARSIAPSSVVDYRLARWQRKAGDPDAAEQAFARVVQASRRAMPEFVAALYLQLGALDLDRGDWVAAERRFAQADERFGGWWLAGAHRAQMRAAAGDVRRAEQGYRAILARFPEPSVMDALAALYRSRGDTAASRDWAARAGRAWAERLRLAPSAASGHALEHELVFGDPDRALMLARRNWQLRPDGDAGALLAWALLGVGRADEALTVLEPLEEAGWRSAQTYVALSESYAQAGRGRDADRARKAALARNPRAFDPALSLLWFGTH